jgi:hypothetical protein
MQLAGPLWNNKRSSFDADGTSEMRHKRTHALRQKSAYANHPARVWQSGVREAEVHKNDLEFHWQH